jgi:hypothetical protein
MVNVHELINTPGAGKAEAALRKAGLWKLTPQEKLQRAMYNLGGYIDDMQSVASDCEDALNDVEKIMRETQ